MEPPYSPSSDRNRDPIAAVLRPLLAGCQRVLEIGSGTGQHAAYFATAFPHLAWQPSDLAGNLPGIRAWREAARAPNLREPIAFDVFDASWPTGSFDAVFTANTLHIMPIEAVETLFRRMPEVLAPGGLLVAYGPFNYGGQFTSDSNAAFDAQLRAGDPRRGIRDHAQVDGWAQAAGLRLLADHSMPAHNRCLVWERVDRRSEVEVT